MPPAEGNGAAPQPGQQQTITASQERRLERAMEMGKIGLWIGSREHAPTTIAGIICMFLALLLAATMFAPLGAGLDRAQALQIVGGFFLAALGYLFGSVSGK
jgi:hypothetical protein